MEQTTKKGIDISYVQKGFDIEKAKQEGVQFVIIRAGYADYVDTEFVTNTDKVIGAGMPYGFYWYSRAFNADEARKEAKACIEAIKKYSPIYPVFYDMEEKEQIDRLTSSERTEIICTFCDEIRAAGYISGVYLNPSWLENYVDKDKILGNYDLWLAHWTENPNNPTKYDYGQIMWQWGLDKINGVGVDGDLCFKDFDENQIPVEPEEPDPDETLPIGEVVIFSGGEQYGASNSDIGYPAKAGVVKITIRANGTLHPYHVISVDDSGVYGWVNSNTLSPCDSENTAEKYKAGAKIVLKNSDLYAAAGAKNAVRKISGTFYLYDGKDVDGYYRICPSEKNVNAVPIANNVTGWVKKGSIIFE